MDSSTMSDKTSGTAAGKRPIGLPPGTMTESHKRALREGRERGQIVRKYLQAIESTKPRRGRPITPEGLRKRIADIDASIASETDPLRKLDLVQAKISKQRELEELENPTDHTAIEDEFVRVAKRYSESKDLSPEAWIELGVPKSVLKRARIL